jgi:xanthine/uracil permease
MSQYNQTLVRVLPPLVTAISVLSLGGGLYSIANPEAFNDVLGIPVTKSNFPFVAFIGARNLSSGLSALVLLYTGQKKAAGTLFMCGVATALVDGWVSYTYGGWSGKTIGHIGMGAVVGLAGAGLVWI